LYDKVDADFVMPVDETPTLWYNYG
jgi:hypothetical protein